MADKKYKVTVKINNTEKSATFIAPQGEKGDPGQDGSKVTVSQGAYTSGGVSGVYKVGTITIDGVDTVLYGINTTSSSSGDSTSSTGEWEQVFYDTSNSTAPSQPTKDDESNFSSNADSSKGWSYNISNSTDSYTWMCQRWNTIMNNTTTNGDWSDPILIKVAGTSAGSDGSYMDFCYARSTSAESNTPSGYYYDSSAENNQVSINSTDNPSSEWSWGEVGDSTVYTDNPQGVDSTWVYEWYWYRTCTDSSDSTTYSSWAGPFVWSHFGKDGKDGDGVEYIYSPTNSNPYTFGAADPSTWEANQDDEYINESYAGSTETWAGDSYSSEYGKWFDNPVDLKEQGTYQFVSVRKKRVDDTNSSEGDSATWGKYSEPVLWGYYAKDGDSTGGEYSGQSKFRSFVFTRADSQPDTPTGGSYNSALPTNTDSEGNSIWSDGIPDGTGAVWYSSRLFTSDGEDPQEETWSTPVKCVDTSDIDFEYSSEDSPATPTALSYSAGTSDYTDDTWHNSNTDWHEYNYFTGEDNKPATTDIQWMAINKCNNNVWEGWHVFKIKGEQGAAGVVNGFTADFDNEYISVAVNENYNTATAVSQNCILHLYYNGIEEDASNYTITYDESNSTTTKSWFTITSGSNNVAVSIPKSTTISQQVVGIFNITCTKNNVEYTVTADVKIAPVMNGTDGTDGTDGTVTNYKLILDPSAINLLTDSTGNPEASTDVINVSVVRTTATGNSQSTSNLTTWAYLNLYNLTLKYKTLIDGTESSETSYTYTTQGVTNTSSIYITNDIVKTLCNRGDRLTVFLYNSAGTCLDYETVPFVTDGVPGTPGTGATSYNFAVESSSLTLNAATETDTTRYASGTVKFDLVEIDHGTGVSKYVQVSSNAYNSSNNTTGIQVMAGGSALTQNTDYTMSVDSSAPYTITVTLKDNKVTANAITLQYYVSTVCMATAVIPMAIQGADGTTTTQTTQTLEYSVLRTVGDYNASESYSDGKTADSSGIMYQDVVTYTPDGDVVNASYYVCIKANDSSNPQAPCTYNSTTGEFTYNTTYWTKIGTTTDSMAVNDLIANYIKSLSISTNQLVILNSSNEVTAGMTGASSITKGIYTDDSGNTSENSTTSTYSSTTDSSGNASSDGNVRIFAGTPANSSASLFDCPFYVTDTGKVHAEDAEITGDVVASTLSTTLTDATGITDGTYTNAEDIANLIAALAYKMYDPNGDPVAGFLVSKSGSTYGAQLAMKNIDGSWYIVNFQKWAKLGETWGTLSVMKYDQSTVFDASTAVTTLTKASSSLSTPGNIYYNSSNLYYTSQSTSDPITGCIIQNATTAITITNSSSVVSYTFYDSNEDMLSSIIPGTLYSTVNVIYYSNGDCKAVFTGNIFIPSSTTTYQIGFQSGNELIIYNDSGSTIYSTLGDLSTSDGIMMLTTSEFSSGTSWSQLLTNPTNYGFVEDTD